MKKTLILILFILSLSALGFLVVIRFEKNPPKLPETPPINPPAPQNPSAEIPPVETPPVISPPINQTPPPIISSLPELNSEFSFGDASNKLNFIYANKHVSLQKLEHGSEIIDVKTTRLWYITLTRPDGAKINIDSNAIQNPIRLETKNNGATQINILRWDPIFVDSGKSISVSMSINYNPEKQDFSWRLKTDLPSGYGLLTAKFPEIKIRPIGSGENDYLTAPLYAGTLVKNPYATIPAPQSYPYPGPFNMQFFSLYDSQNKSGIYWATHDGSGHPKKFTIAAENGALTFGVSHYGPIPTPLNYEIPYPFVLSYLDGDWFTAASKYRAWAEGESMTEKGKWANSSQVSSKIKTMKAMYLLSPADENFNDHDRFASEAKKAADFLDTKNIMIYWYRWHQHLFDTKWPDIQPKSTFIAATESVKQKGLSVIPYFLPGFWDVSLPTYTSEVKNASCWAEDGKPKVYPSGNTDPQKVFDAVRLDPSFAFAKDHEKQIINTFVNNFNADGIYYDYWSGVDAGICFNVSANHPQNGGNYWEQNKKALGKTARDYGRSLKSGFILTSESLDENLIPALDMMHSAPLDMTFVPPNVLPVPLWSAVYHDYILASSFSGFNPLNSTSSEAVAGLGVNNLYQAISYSYGRLISFTNWFADVSPFFNQNINDANPIKPTLLYAKNLTDSYDYTRGYVLEGEMLRPLPGTFFDSFNFTPETLSLPWSSVWKSNSGKIGIVLVNPSAGSSLIHTNFVFETYGIPQNKTVKIYETNIKETKKLIAQTKDSYRIDRAIQPFDVVLLEFEY